VLATATSSSTSSPLHLLVINTIVLTVFPDVVLQTIGFSAVAGVADVLSVIIGAEMLKIVPGRVSTEVRRRIGSQLGQQQQQLPVSLASSTCQQLYHFVEASSSHQSH
jgi:hypothetical protein